MADANGQMSDKDLKKVQEWLRDKGVENPCSRCGKDRFYINNHLMRVTSFNTHFPTVLVHCLHCTFTMFYSAKVIGISLPDGKSGGGDDK